MSSYEYVVAPRSVDVLPTRASRRLTRRDALLPLVLTLELFVGVAFGLASASGSTDATSVPAKLSLGPAPVVTVLPSLRPLASMTPLAASGPVVGPVVPVVPSVGPAVGPLRPGTVRPPVAVSAPVQPVATAAGSAPYPTHAPRDPFRSLVPPTG